jgi:integrase
MAYGDGRIRRMKGSPYWYAVYFLRGTEFTESTKCTDEKAARKFLKDKLRKIACDLEGTRRFTTPMMAKIRVSDLIADLKEDYRVRSKLSAQTICHFKRLERDFGKAIASNLTPQEIKAYISHRQEIGEKASTINRTLQLLNQTYTLAQNERGFVGKPHITKLSEADNVRMECYDMATFHAIVRNLAEPVVADLAIFCHEGGSRRGETLKLLWESKQGDLFKLPPANTKSKKPRSISMTTPELQNVLQRRQAARSITVNGVTHVSRWVFSRFNFKKNCFEPIRYFYKAWKSACRKAGLTGAGQGWFHSLRKCFATESLAAGNDPLIVMEQGGWSSTTMLKRYNVITDEALRKAAERTAAYRATLPTELPASNVIPMQAVQK